MMILFSPQVSIEDTKFRYKFEGETITVTFEDVTDIFDFSEFNTDGELYDIETSLPINPILSAKRKDGILYVELLNLIGADATEEERFPTWKEGLPNGKI